MARGVFGPALLIVQAGSRGDSQSVLEAVPVKTRSAYTPGQQKKTGEELNSSAVAYDPELWVYIDSLNLVAASPPFRPKRTPDPQRQCGRFAPCVLQIPLESDNDVDADAATVAAVLRRNCKAWTADDALDSCQTANTAAVPIPHTAKPMGFLTGPRSINSGRIRI